MEWLNRLIEPQRLLCMCQCLLAVSICQCLLAVSICQCLLAVSISQCLLAVSICQYSGCQYFPVSPGCQFLIPLRFPLTFIFLDMLNNKRYCKQSRDRQQCVHKPNDEDRQQQKPKTNHNATQDSGS